MSSHLSLRRPRAAHRPARRLRPRHLQSLVGGTTGATRSPRVMLAGKLTAQAAPGGGEVQLTSLVRALVREGVDAHLWRPWHDDFRQVELLHLVGSSPELLPLVRAARERGIPTVLSPVAWFGFEALWREPAGLVTRAARCAKLALRATVPALATWRSRLYREVDLLLPNSQAEARQLERYFRVPSDRIQVVPNGADPDLLGASGELFRQHVGLDRFVLYAGRIEPRKNQLGFLRAVRPLDLPVVILGDVVPGHQAYAAACRAAAGPRVRFVPRLEHGSPLWASAFAAATCLCLASWFETPGLVALEAGMLGVPLVLPRVGAAPEYFGNLARYVDPASNDSIRTAVVEAFAAPRCARLRRHVRQHYSWTTVAQATWRAYAQVL